MAASLGVIAFIVMLLFAILFHEFGHFITARWAGIKVSRFFIGFGPTLWSTRRGRMETIVGLKGKKTKRPEMEFGIKAFPIGGFVKVVGMSPFEEIDPVDVPRSFSSVPTWKRAIVLAAGSVTHVISAFIILLVIFSVVGVPNPDKPTTTLEAVAGEIAGKTSPAAKAGLKPGDRVASIDGHPVGSWEDVRTRIRSSPGRLFTLGIDRDGRRIVVDLAPVSEKQGSKTIGVIGVYPRQATQRLGPIHSVQASGRAMRGLFATFFRFAPRAFSPQSLGLSGRPSNERAISIIGAGRLAVDLATQGQIAMFLFLFVQINIFIAVFNMLPLPPLDGGHLLMLGIEKIRGKPVDQRALVPVMAVVVSLLVLLGVLLVYYDIVSPVGVPGR